MNHNETMSTPLPTPETDAAQIRQNIQNQGVPDANWPWEAIKSGFDFARKLELERNEARALVAKQTPAPESYLMDRPWIGVDLDGTLAHYDEWRGIEHIGPPIEEMRLRVRQWLDEGQEVRILTARVGPQRQDVPHTIAEITQHIEAWCLTHLGQVLRVTSQKDYCMVAFWDDRCVQVVPNTGRSLETELAAANAHIMAQREELLLLRTWNQRALNAIHPDAKVTTNPDSLRGLTLIPDGIPIASERDTQIGIEAELRKRLAEAERDAEVLATILSRVLDSSRPHPVDHPSMHREWASARVGLTAYEMKKAKPVLETAE